MNSHYSEANIGKKDLGVKVKRTAHNVKKRLLTALVANQKGKIFELEGYAAVGMAGPLFEPLTVDSTCNMPYGSELMYLPDRKPILLNLDSGRMETVNENPYTVGEPIFPVAAFNSPGYVVVSIGSYRENRDARYLPLFSYGAVGWYRGHFRSAVVRVDAERRQDLRFMKHEDVLAGIDRTQKQMPKNRLRAHLEKCALEYGCPAAKNFFLGRFEAPLPTAEQCNARCMGCLSLQRNSGIAHSQERIGFTPSAAEITEVALTHIQRVDNSVVSFGQGCEGDPLLVTDVIKTAVRQIRSVTGKGTIHMNTNGSLPANLKQLFAVGLDSIRISMNSVRKKCYDAYFRPKGYGFTDVLKSIEIALENEKFVAVNYLNCPGFTDTPQEVDAFLEFLQKYPIHMIQWRNLNFDPVRYWKKMKGITRPGKPLGVQNVLTRVRKQFPDLKFGYFNPPKEKF